MKIRNKRPGALLITDAKLKLVRGEVVEVEQSTPQLENALEQGFVEKVPEGTPIGSPESAPAAPVVPVDYERLSASEAIEYVDVEDDLEKLKAIQGMEKRKTVRDALRKRLEEVETGVDE